jgi:hypothetical protein
MALSDPQSITVNAVAQSMPRISTTSGNNQRKSNYQKTDKSYSLEVLHRDIQRSGRPRIVSLVSFTNRITATDPLNANNQYYDTMTWSVQLDRPEAGFTSTTADQMWTGMKTWFDSTLVGKIFGGES